VKPAQRAVMVPVDREARVAAVLDHRRRTAGEHMLHEEHEALNADTHAVGRLEVPDRRGRHHGIAIEGADADVVRQVREARDVVLVEVGDVEPVERRDAEAGEVRPRPPIRGGVVAAVDHDALAVAGNDQRASAVLDVENL